MSRVLQTGFEVPDENGVSRGSFDTIGFDAVIAAGFGGLAQRKKNTDGFTAPSKVISPALVISYHRVKFRVRSWPTTASSKNGVQSIWASGHVLQSGVVVTIEGSGSIGTLQVWNYAAGSSVKALLCWGSIALNTSYIFELSVSVNTRVDVLLDLDPPPGVWDHQLCYGGTVYASLNGASLSGPGNTGREGSYVYPPGGPLAGGIDTYQLSPFLTNNLNNVVLGAKDISTPLICTSLDGRVDLDHAAADNATACGDGYHLSLWPRAPGQWTTWNGQAWGDRSRSMRTSPTWYGGTGNGNSTNVSGAQVSYLLPTLRESGATSPSVGDVFINLQIATGWTATVTLWVNGTPYNQTVVGASSYNVNARFSGLTIGLDDTLEIGITKDATATSRVLYYLMLSVEVPAWTAVARSGDIQIAWGTYAGNNSYQRIEAGFDADWILTQFASGTGAGSGFTWARPSRQAGKVNSGDALAGDAIPSVDATGFYVSNFDTNNATGRTYDWIAIKDPQCRLQVRGNATPTAAVDNWNATMLEAPTFLAEMLWAMPRWTSAVNRFSIRAPGHMGDAATTSFLLTGAQPDYIQSIGVGTWQGGLGLLASSPWNVEYVGWRTGYFAFNVLAEFVQWTGDGAAEQVLTLSQAASTPILAVALPCSTGLTARHMWLRTPSMTGANSRPLDGAIATGGISAFGVGSLSVGSDLNETGVVYSALVLYEGLDPEYVEYVGSGGLSFGGAAITELVPEAEFTDAQVAYPLTWIELTDRAEAVHVFAEVDLNDPASYYGGYKAPWVLRFLAISRGLSDRLGQLEHLSFGALLSDTTRFFRGLLEGILTRYLVNRPMTERMIDDDDRRLLGLPRLAAVGYSTGYAPKPNLQFEITGSDWLKKKFSRRAKAEQAWQPLITIEDFPAAPAAVIDTPCPLCYGRISDAALGTVPSPLYPRDNLDPGWTENSVRCGAGSIPNDQWLVFYVTRIYQGRESNGGIFFARWGGDCHPTDPFGARIVWNKLTEVDLYRIYFADTAGWHPFDNPLGTNIGRYLDLTPAQVLDPSPLGPGLVEYTIAALTEGADHKALVGQVEGEEPQVPYGLVPALPVSTEQLGGATGEVWTQFLVAGHAVKEIEAVFLGGKQAAAALYGTGLGQELLVPGFTGWSTFFSTNYREINGRRYTIIYARGNAAIKGLDGSARLTVNIKGIEDVGDGSGALITAIALQAKHFVRNFLAPDAPPGTLWLTAPPTFPHVTDLPLVDESSFDLVDAAAKVRLPPDGYEGAGILGSGGAVLTGLDALAQFCVSGDFDVFINRLGQLAVSMEPIYPTTGVTPLDDVLNIVDQSFEIRDDVSGEFYNILPYAHSRDYTGRTKTGWGEVTDAQSDLSIDFYEQERTAPRFDLTLLRSESAQGAATIADVMARKLGRYRDPRRTATLTVPFSGLSREPGDVVPITHLEGIGAAGWVDHDVRILRHEVEPTEGRVRLDCYDLETLFDLTGLWAPEDTPDRGAASDEERRLYLFWAPESPNNFYSDGAAVKSWS